MVRPAPGRDRGRTANLSCGGISSTWWSIVSTVAVAGVGRVGHRVGHEPLDQRVDVAVQGGREEQPLARPPGVLLQQRGHVGQEAHVGHLVGLVEHGDLDVVQRADAPLDQVAEPARAWRRGRPRRGAARRSAGRTATPPKAVLVKSPTALAERDQRVVDLHGQFPGGHQDQRPGVQRRGPGCGRRAGRASAGRRRASCRSRSGPGRARRGRRARPGWWPAGSGTAW